MLTLLKNQTVFVDEVEYRVISGEAGLETLLENIKTGERAKFSTSVLLGKYLTGEFKTAAHRKQELRDQSRRGARPARMDGLSRRAKKLTHRRIDYLVRLEREGSFAKHRAELREDIKQIATAKGESEPPHESTIYRWRRAYLQAQKDVRALFARFDKRGGHRQSRLSADVEALIDEVVEEVALRQRVCSANDLREGLVVKIAVANRTRAADDQLQVPSLRTMQRRLAMLAAFDLTGARHGQEEAERRFALHGVSRPVERLLEIVEIDHSLVDLMVVGADRVTVGRPTLTVVIDRASRCCLGYHLSLAGHGAPAVFEALRHALMPKLYLKDGYAALELEWECFGWFERVVMDNGREFHADAVVDALLNLGIICEFAASRSPNDKPHVESFLRTFNYTFIHKLQGTTLAKAHKRIGFKPEADAVMTLEELDRIIHVWICQKYHLRPNRGLSGRAPITVWRELAKANPPQLKMNAQDVDIEFSERAESRLQHYGIDLNTFVYRSDRLLMLRRLLPAKATVTVKWPRNDVGHIYVRDSTTDEYFKVPNTKREYAGLTLAQAKAAQKAKSAGDPSYVQAQAEAGAIIRGLVAEAEASTKLARRRQGSRLANRTSRAARDASAVVDPDPSVALLDDVMAPGVVALDEVIDDIHIDLPAVEAGGPA